MSFKIAYFNAVFALFYAENHPNIIKHDKEINFEPIERDLENPMQEQITSVITNLSCNTKAFKSFFLFSWDVGRPGLWYSIEPCSSRDQFKEVTRWWPKGVGNGQRSQIFVTLSRNKQQGRSAYFQSVYSNKVYYGKILAFDTYKSCLQ